MVIPQRLFRGSPVLLTYLVKSAHPVCDQELQGGPGEITEGSAGRLVVQEHAEEATVNRQPDAVLGYKAKLLELISVHTSYTARVFIWSRRPSCGSDPCGKAPYHRRRQRAEKLHCEGPCEAC